MTRMMLIVLMLAVTAAGAADPTGTWKGTLEAGGARLRLVLHVEGPAEGPWTASLDSPDQGAADIPASWVELGGGELIVSFADLGAEYRGAFAGPDSLAGTWAQGGRGFPLALVRGEMAEAPSPPVSEALLGTWKGILTARGTEIPLVLRVARADDGTADAALDSPEQGATGLVVTELLESGGRVTFAIPIIGGSFEGRLDSAGRVIEGTWTQAGHPAPLRFEFTEDDLRPDRPQVPQPPFPYGEEEVEFPNAEAGITLAGTLTLPAGAGPHPAAVLVSGSGAQDRDETVFDHKPFLILADALARRGIAVLRYDDRGVGGSTGDHAAATTADLAGDAAAALAFMRDRAEIDTLRLGIIGHSEGGLIAPMIGARDPDLGFAVLLAGPGVPGRDLLGEQMTLVNLADGKDPAAVAAARPWLDRIFGFVADCGTPETAAAGLDSLFTAMIADLGVEAATELELGPESKEAQLRALASPWIPFFLRYDPRPDLEATRCPVLALLGEKDLQVPPSIDEQPLREAVAAAANPASRVVVLPGLNHLFQPAKTGSIREYYTIETTMDPQVPALIGDWILGLPLEEGK